MEVFRRAGLDMAEEDLAALAEEAVAVVRPRFSFALADEHTAVLLAEAGFDMSPGRPGEMDRLVAGETLAYTALLADSLSVAEVARRLGVDPSRIRQRVTGRSLCGVRVGREWRLPAWQFDETAAIPHLQRVLEALSADLDPVSIARFMTFANEELLMGGEPVAPRVWLAAGRDPEPVVRMAGYLESD